MWDAAPLPPIVEEGLLKRRTIQRTMLEKGWHRTVRALERAVGEPQHA